MNLSGFERFVQVHGCKNGWKSFCEHGLTRTGRSDEYGIVSACCGNFQGTFDVFLSLYIAEVDREVIDPIEKCLLCIQLSSLDGLNAIKMIDDLLDVFCTIDF